MGDCLLFELAPDSSTQGGKVSGSLAVMLHGITFVNEPDTGGRVSGPLNEAPSILSGVPSKTCVPCLGTRPRSLFFRCCSRWFYKKRKKNPDKGVDKRARSPYGFVSAPEVPGWSGGLTRDWCGFTMISPTREKAL
jgi:hypothetical protein